MASRYLPVPANVEAFLKENYDTNPFLRSIYSKVYRYGQLTQGQIDAVLKFIENGSSRAPEGIELGGDAGVIKDMLTEAKNHKRFPKLIFLMQHPDHGDESIKMHLSGPSSKNPNCLNITSKDEVVWNERFQNTSGVWYGRMEGDKFIPSRTALKRWDGEFIKVLTKFLKHLVTDPEGAVKENAKLTCNCCFCNRTLSDQRSIEAGYGPVCADNHGLDWG